MLSPGDYARRSPIFPTGYVALASASQTHLLPVDDGPSRVASHVRHRMPSCPAVAGANARLSAPHPPLDSTRDDLWYDGWAGLRLRCPGQTCVLADTLLGAEAERYDHGILCKRTLRPLRIYTKGNPCAAATPPHPSRPRLPLLRCEALMRSAADNMRSSGSAPLPAARCSVACCTLQRCSGVRSHRTGWAQGSRKRRRRGWLSRSPSAAASLARSCCRGTRSAGSMRRRSGRHALRRSSRAPRNRSGRAVAERPSRFLR